MSCHLQSQTPVPGSAAACCVPAGQGSQQPGSLWTFPGATQNLPRACYVVLASVPAHLQPEHALAL